MKTKLTAILLLAIICLSLVVSGISSPQPVAHAQVTGDYKVYLPVVAKPPCTYVRATAYVAVNRPIMRVGDLVTVAGALMNDCTLIGQPRYHLGTQPEGLLFPSYIITDIYPTSIDYGAYQEFTFTVQAIQAGVVSITVAASYETRLPDWPPGMWTWDAAVSGPAVIRILP